MRCVVDIVEQSRNVVAQVRQHRRVRQPPCIVCAALVSMDLNRCFSLVRALWPLFFFAQLLEQDYYREARRISVFMSTEKEIDTSLIVEVVSPSMLENISVMLFDRVCSLFTHLLHFSFSFPLSYLVQDAFRTGKYASVIMPYDVREDQNKNRAQP